MRVLLVVQRAETGRIEVMLWGAMAADPELIETRSFQGTAGLAIWLAGIGTRYGRSNVTVDWETLRSDDGLSAVVRECIGES